MLANTGFSDWEREYRRMKRRELYEYQRDWKHQLGYVEDVGWLPDTRPDEYERALARVMVEQATRYCTEDERALLHMVYFEGRSVLEISRASGVAYRTLGYRIERALSKCRWALGYRHGGKPPGLPGVDESGGRAV